MKFGHFLTFILSLGMIGGAHGNASTIQNVKEIRDTAKSFLESHYSAAQESTDSSRVKITVGKVDPRLRLAKCDQPLTGFIPQGTDLKGNSVLSVRCVGAVSWHIYVPVAVQIYQPTVVFKRPLRKGQAISAKDLAIEPIEISRLRVVTLNRKEEIVGSILKQNARVGQPATSAMACMVCKGDKLAVIAQNSAFSVSMEGEALEDGHYGETVRVKNANSKRIIRGTVVASRKVSVSLMLSAQK